MKKALIYSQETGAVFEALKKERLRLRGEDYEPHFRNMTLFDGKAEKGIDLVVVEDCEKYADAVLDAYEKNTLSCHRCGLEIDVCPKCRTEINVTTLVSSKTETRLFSISDAEPEEQPKPAKDGGRKRKPKATPLEKETESWQTQRPAERLQTSELMPGT